MAQLVTIQKLQNVAQIITPQHIYIYMWIYIYIHMLLCSACSVSLGSAAHQLSQKVREISGVVLGHHADNEALENPFLSFSYKTAFWGQVGVKPAFFFCKVQQCPELRGKWAFHFSNPEMATRSSKSRSSKKGNIYLLGRAHPHFRVFGCRASILQKKKRVCENRPNFTETTENVAPKCRG